MDYLAEKLHLYLLGDMLIVIVFLIIIKKNLDIDLAQIFKGFALEIKSLASGKLNKPALNAFAGLLILIFLILAMFNDTVGDLILLTEAVHEKKPEKLELAPLGLFILAITMLFSLVLVGNDKDNI